MRHQHPEKISRVLYTTITILFQSKFLFENNESSFKIIPPSVDLTQLEYRALTSANTVIEHLIQA